MPNRARLASFSLVLAIAGGIALAACGSSGDDNGFTPPAGSGPDGGGGNALDGSLLGNNHDVGSLTIDPPMASIESLNGAPVKQPFKAIGHLNDGTTMQLTSGVSWSATQFQVGAVDATGVYTASGSVGGVVTILAQYKGVKATATLTVKLHITENPGNVPGTTQNDLKGAVNPDGTVVWAYPYDKTVWPRGLAGPTMQWNNGAASDDYYVHVTSPTFELETFTTVPPPARFDFAGADWQKFVDSTNGAANLQVNRWDGSKATVVVKHGWTVAPASMRGTIYYWANNAGRVMRIKPGASAPDDFANKAPLNDPNQYVQSSCLMTCHAVSADGSTIISGGGTYGGSYNLLTSQPTHYLGGTWGNPNGTSDGSVVQWMAPALSPNGKYLLVNTMGVGLSTASGRPASPQAFEGFYDTATGALVPNSGFDGLFPAMPAFSPEGSKVAWIEAGDPLGGAWSGGWNNPPPGDLKVVDFDPKKTPMASNPRTLIATGADPNKRIGWPTFSPDGKWVVYQRGASADTRGGNADLYIASATQPNVETRLAALDGDGYPFAAGSRDLSWNFEPTFAPVAAGGYFWVVFTSRRTYGNTLTGAPQADGNGFLGTKQLWVAAIDQSPQPGKDPSHPPFRLPGQAVDTINMRGFWALDPCKGDGQGCASGTECCGGYCDDSGDAGAPVCKSHQTMCSQNGDRCDLDTDCCNAMSGVTCINHVCSEPPPR